MKIIEALEQLKREIALLDHFWCEPLRATISQYHCQVNQRKARFFDEAKREYFRADLIGGRNGKSEHKIKRRNYGFHGSKSYFEPNHLECLNCERMEKG